MFASGYELLVSRLDLFADVQGWAPALEDLHRFVGYGRSRRGFEERNEVFTAGHRLTGFTFGRDALVARVYDKTREIGRRGIAEARAALRRSPTGPGRGPGRPKAA